MLITIFDITIEVEKYRGMVRSKEVVHYRNNKVYKNFNVGKIDTQNAAHFFSPL